MPKRAIIVGTTGKDERSDEMGQTDCNPAIAKQTDVAVAVYPRGPCSMCAKSQINRCVNIYFLKRELPTKRLNVEFC